MKVWIVLRKYDDSVLAVFASKQSAEGFKLDLETEYGPHFYINDYEVIP